jgi:cytochrome c oxidase subunit 2
MASLQESSVAPQPPGWAQRFPRDERLFMWIVIASVAVMSAFVIGWLAWGNQNVPTASYATSPDEFSAQVSAFATKYTAADGKVHVPPGTDAYMLAARYTFYPELVLKAKATYRIWISSADSLHGFSIVGGNQNINLEIAPNHAFGATFTPEKPGTYLVVCNEYCGLGHHTMLGRIHVER